MLKKIDQLVYKAFLGPFFLTYFVVLFILLTQYMLKYFKDFLGKNLGMEVFGELFFYFALNMTPVALPLAVLLSSLMCFGNLGEHNELTAIKSTGISLIRVLAPVFFFVIALTAFTLYFNDRIVPFANLKAYSLLYDIRQKKPALEFEEGVFYNGLPGFSIKVDAKEGENKDLLRGLMIYNHSARKGNTELIMADSGLMYTVNNDRFLALELYDGSIFQDYSQINDRPDKDEFVRSRFKSASFLFSLESFGMSETKEELFKSNNVMKNIGELSSERDSINVQMEQTLLQMRGIILPYFSFFYDLRKPAAIEALKNNLPTLPTADSSQTALIDSSAKNIPLPEIAIKKFARGKKKRIDSLSVTTGLTVNSSELQPVLQPLHEQSKNTLAAFSRVTSIKSLIETNISRLENYRKMAIWARLDVHRKYTQAIACLIMFLIGAPLGAIIKKGGLGVPVLVSIFFFILFYIFTLTGEKYAKQEVTGVIEGAWAANAILFAMSLFFLKKAHSDARLFENDYYAVLFEKAKMYLGSKMRRHQKT